jgi:CheY-like chemotaxis protein
MDVFSKLRGRVGEYLEHRKVQNEIAECEAQIAASPTDITPLQRLAELYVGVGRIDDAITCFSTAADLARGEKRPEAAIAFYRKAERVATADRRLQVLRRMLPIYTETKAYSQAFQLAREIMEFYLATGQSEVASGFLKTLPALGDKDAAYRNQLGNLLANRSATWTETDDTKSTWRIASTASPVREDFSSLAILLVDDEIAQLKLYTRALEALGCELMLAGNGLEALERMTERRPNLIICDLVMPRMDGSQLYETLQSDPRTEAIPFVCLSAQSEEAELVAALERGIEDYWTKPIRPKELRARVKRILRRIKDYATLSGSLSEMSVPDLLQMLEVNARTGSLLVESEGRSAMLYIVDGRPMDAVYRGYEGEAAIYAIIDWREGRFQFSSRLPDRPQRIFTSAQGLLLEAMRRFDEQAEARTSLPSDLGVRLVLAEEPKPSQFPAEASLSDFHRLREVLDGRTLGEVLDGLEGRLETIRLLVALYEVGVVQVAPAGRGRQGDARIALLGTTDGPPEVTFQAPDSDPLDDVRDTPFEHPTVAFDSQTANPFAVDAAPFAPALPASLNAPARTRASESAQGEPASPRSPARSLDDQVKTIQEGMPDFER